MGIQLSEVSEYDLASKLPGFAHFQGRDLCYPRRVNDVAGKSWYISKCHRIWICNDTSCIHIS